MHQILCLSGSLRSASFNTRLLHVAHEVIDTRGAHGAPVAADTLRALPLMDQDLESSDGLPTAAQELKKAFAGADGILLACPEYNGSITPLLKNVIDWVSRPDEALPAARCFGGKPVALISASPGGLGGLRGLRHVREIIGNLGALMVPKQFALGSAGDAFDEAGALHDARKQQALDAVIDDLLHWVEAAKGAR